MKMFENDEILRSRLENLVIDHNDKEPSLIGWIPILDEVW